jgi:hypothetical protein
MNFKVNNESPVVLQALRNMRLMAERFAEQGELFETDYDHFGIEENKPRKVSIDKLVIYRRRCVLLTHPNVLAKLLVGVDDREDMLITDDVVVNSNVRLVGDLEIGQELVVDDDIVSSDEDHNSDDDGEEETE